MKYCSVAIFSGKDLDNNRGSPFSDTQVIDTL